MVSYRTRSSNPTPPVRSAAVSFVVMMSSKGVISQLDGSLPGSKKQPKQFCQVDKKCLRDSPV